jgi:hypothetical protein
MMKRPTFSSRIDPKQFFEASVHALREESKSVESRCATGLRSRALVQRITPDEILRKRAVADAARALSILWKAQTSKSTI